MSELRETKHLNRIARAKADDKKRRNGLTRKSVWVPNQYLAAHKAFVESLVSNHVGVEEDG